MPVPEFIKEHKRLSKLLKQSCKEGKDQAAELARVKKKYSKKKHGGNCGCGKMPCERGSGQIFGRPARVAPAPQYPDYPQLRRGAPPGPAVNQPVQLAARRTQAEANVALAPALPKGVARKKEVKAPEKATKLADERTRAATRAILPAAAPKKEETALDKAFRLYEERLQAALAELNAPGATARVYQRKGPRPTTPPDAPAPAAPEPPALPASYTNPSTLGMAQRLKAYKVSTFGTPKEMNDQRKSDIHTNEQWLMANGFNIDLALPANQAALKQLIEFVEQEIVPAEWAPVSTETPPTNVYNYKTYDVIAAPDNFEDFAETAQDAPAQEPGAGVGLGKPSKKFMAEMMKSYKGKKTRGGNKAALEASIRKYFIQKPLPTYLPIDDDLYDDAQLDNQFFANPPWIWENLMK